MIRVLTLFASVALLLSGPSARAQDASDLIVRLNRVEGQMRQLSGQVEQLGFENRQLKDQLRKFQEDTEFRFQERGGGARSPTAAPQGGTPPGGRPSGNPDRPARRGDAFDPSADPAAPGAPRTLGSGAPAASAGGGRAASERGAPEPSRGGPEPSRGGGIAALIDEDDDDAPPPGRRPLDLGAASRGGSQASVAPSRAPEASPRGSVGTDDSRADYDAAYAFLIQRQYERAESAFRGFLQSHPRDRLVPDAVYWLGETYLQRSRPREAAEQFLKVSTEHARSPKAPDAMLKLGMALSALGAKDQACATFAEVERKYPAASPSLKQGVDREQKRARCTS